MSAKLPAKVQQKLANLSHDDLIALATKQLIRLHQNTQSVTKYHKKNRKRCSDTSRKYYFKKNDIYHPELNPNGLQEKQFKRTVLIT